MIQSNTQQCDVLIVGGAFSGASTAICLLRRNPELRVVVVERSDRFKRRVGEATVEISGYFLTRVLGLTAYLNQQHLIKQGFRFWMDGGPDADLSTASEIGAKYLARVPAFQLDRAELDEEILRRAEAAGAQVWRPAHVEQIDTADGGTQCVRVRRGGETIDCQARWVVDATGVASVLGRRLGWIEPNEAHPTTAVWSRWTGVKDWDGLELAQRHPDWAGACYGTRGTATNHFMGDGWWAWCIPLKSGHTSIGVVYDQRLFTWPTEGSLADQIKTVLAGHPVGREILADAEPDPEDIHLRRNLSYRPKQLAADGYAVVGDAAGFIDPFYSPGLDWVSYTVYATAALIADQFSGADPSERIRKHNADFVRCYQRWFEAIYRDKYEIMGDYDLLRTAFRLDLGLYYMGVVSQPFKKGPDALLTPVFSDRASGPFFRLIRFYNRRLARMARARRARGMMGRKNRGRRDLMDGFKFEPSSAFKIMGGLARWARFELTEGWRSWFAYKASAEPARAAPEAEAPPVPALGADA